MKAKLTLLLLLLFSFSFKAQEKQVVNKIISFLQKREIELAKKNGASLDYEKSLKGKRKFVLREIDLNNDNKKDYFVFFNEDCGNGGCSALVLDSKLNVRGNFTLVGLPIIVKKEQINGWNTLNIESKGMRKVIFNPVAKRYGALGIANEKLLTKPYEKVKGDQIILELPDSETYSSLKSFMY
ncbi:hypothetical protein [Flavobacterium oreochromis]|uniref:Uncharacterized protein n=3 Tax=Flavobacterium TaxID=237 RepID=A0A246GDB2_9FLAO|nr:hypothetical protein [Flavobacterium oreochromis]OWP78491.1 hypothetical protein BWG23_01610 [Flavobacterium oreochromis]OWP79260.1 hypothetical protein BWK62_02850 [Flavobacterium oreochromis]POR30477.1 hypothetical protein BWK58_01800 [Flavobacterium columnare]